MAFEPGDVVFLKSGGQPLTVIAAEDENVECIWLGEEGELFRDTIPSVALTKASDALADEDEDEDDESDEDGETDEDDSASVRRSVA